MSDQRAFSHPPLLGVIADDFTGATDVASMLVRAGLRTVQTIGVPQGPVPEADALVVALKSRTAPVDEAVRESLAAATWLRAAGVRQLYFKYCSTFDSTPTGNIGPVSEALMALMETDLTVVCPAFPENARTVYQGHLFVGDILLSDSSMRNHPLTPMRDASLLRLLQPQLPAGRRVGLVAHDVVGQGASAVAARLDVLRDGGASYAVLDTLDNDDLMSLGSACVDLPLVTGGSGLALGLAEALRAAGRVPARNEATRLPVPPGRQAVVSGSCSAATNGQVAHWIAEGRPAWRMEAARLAFDSADTLAREALDWASRQGGAPVLVYATATPEDVRLVQGSLGVDQAGAAVERCLALVASGLIDHGVTQLVVAGGETSGAVVKALGVDQLRIGPTIDPGVPWTATRQPNLLLALKSGNFGTPNFFSKALAQVPT